jgi:hypothetical protein
MTTIKQAADRWNDLRDVALDILADFARAAI